MMLGYLDIADVVLRIAAFVSIVYLLQAVGACRDVIDSNTFYGVSGDDDGASCSVDFDVISQVSKYMYAPGRGCQAILVIQAIGLLLKNPCWETCFGKLKMLVMVVDVALFITIISLLVVSVAAYSFAFPISVYGTSVYFTLSSLSLSSSLLGCFLDISTVLHVLIALAIAAVAIFASTTVSLVDTVVSRERAQFHTFQKVSSLELETGTAHSSMHRL